MSRWLYFPSSWTDTKAIRFNGTSQLVYINNPSFKSDSAGFVSGWVRFPSLLVADGQMAIFTQNVSDAGNDSTYLFSLRRNTGNGNTNCYLDIIYRATNGGTAYAKSGSTAISANTWYHFVVGSGGKIYLNGTEETYQYWIANHFASGWLGGLSGSNFDFALAGIRRAGVVSSYGQCDLNELTVGNAAPTSGDATEMYNSGVTKDPNAFTTGLRAKIVLNLGFENNTVPYIGSGTYTAVGSPTYV